MVGSWLMWIIITVLVGAVVATTPRDRRGVRPLVTTTNVVALLMVLYFIFPSAGLMLNGANYTWALGYGGWPQLEFTLLMMLVATSSFVVPILCVRALRSTRMVSPPSVTTQVLDSDVGRWVPLALLIIGLGLKVYLVATTGGIDAMLLRLSGNARETGQVSGLDAGDIGIRTLSGIADAAATWLLCSSMKKGQRQFSWMLLWLMTIALSYATVGKRLALLLPIIVVILAFHHYVRPLTVRMFPVLVFGAMAFGMGTLLFRIYASANAGGVVIDLDQVSYARGSLLLFYLNSLEFSTVEMMTVVIESRDAIASQFGSMDASILQLFIMPIFYTVPRVLWPNKPDQVFDLSYSVSSAILGRRAEDSNVGYITTLVGNSYFAGALFGVVMAFFLFALVCEYLDKKMLRAATPNVVRVVAFGLAVILAFHFFRMGTIAWTFLIGIVQQYGFIVGALVIAVSARHRVRPRSPLIAKPAMRLDPERVPS